MGNIPQYGPAAPMNPALPPAAHQPYIHPSLPKNVRFPSSQDSTNHHKYQSGANSHSGAAMHSPEKNNNQSAISLEKLENSSEVDSESMCVFSSDESDVASDVPTTVSRVPQARTLMKNKRKKGRPLKVVLGAKHLRIINDQEASAPSPPTLTKAPSAITSTNSIPTPAHQTRHAETASTISSRNPNIYIAENSAHWAGPHPQATNHMPVQAQAPPPPPHEEPTLLVTITDTTNIQRMFCQKITYQEAANLNLRDFYVQRWEQVNGVAGWCRPYDVCAYSKHLDSNLCGDSGTRKHPDLEFECLHLSEPSLIGFVCTQNCSIS